MALSNAVPQQRDVWFASFGSNRDGEPGKHRPVIVMSTARSLSGSAFDLVIVVPLSASLPPSAVRPRVPATPESGLAVNSSAVARAIRGVSRARLLHKLGVVDASVHREIMSIVITLCADDTTSHA